MTGNYEIISLTAVNEYCKERGADQLPYKTWPIRASNASTYNKRMQELELMINDHLEKQSLEKLEPQKIKSLLVFDEAP